MLQDANAAKSALSEATTCHEKGFDKSKLIPSTSTSISRSSVTSGAISVVNSKRNGKRISLPRDVMERLNNPKTVQIGYTENQIVVAERLFDDNPTFTPRWDKRGRAIIYAADLVREITERFSLDFTNRVSITFHDVEYHEIDCYPVAVISVS